MVCTPIYSFSAP
jgi:hypothetical protein